MSHPDPATARHLSRRSNLGPLIALSMATAGGVRAQPPAATAPGSGVQSFADPTGIVATLDIDGRARSTGAFFQSLGTNGRSCDTCHVASQAMSISAQEVQARFAATHGQDPLFAPVDGANCPSGRPGRAADHSLLLNHGLIRVSLPIPAGAQFSVSVAYDPYGCALLPDPNGGPGLVSVFRRPLPSTNLNQLSTLMFDGRETLQPLNVEQTFPANLVADLTQQASDAVTTHAQAATPPTSAQLADIVNFELGLFTAQTHDDQAGSLDRHGAQGGPANLAVIAGQYHPGINDSLGGDPSGNPFNPASMTIFSAWTNTPDPDADAEKSRRDAARRAIAAGETLFDSAPLHISNVRGINDNPALGQPSTLTGTCTTCHDTPNTGNHSFPLPLDIGTSHSPLSGMEPDPNIIAALAELSTPTVPVYLISGCPDPYNPAVQEPFYTSDPGKALITGLCSDLNRGKGPILRGLAARAPYFHNGAAKNLRELVNFYDQRFQMGLKEQQKEELIAFLDSL